MIRCHDENERQVANAREEVKLHMYKTDLIREIAKETRVSQRAVSDVVDAMLGQITRALARQERVQLPGFGSFYSRERGESRALNFKTGRAMTVPAGRQAAFRVGEALRQAVRHRKKKRGLFAR